MKIDLTKIEGYENMTAEEKIAALEGFDVQQDYTGYVRKDLLDKANSEAADYKRQLRAAMSEAEKKAADDEEARKAMEERLKQLETEKEYADRKAAFAHGVHIVNIDFFQVNVVGRFAADHQLFEKRTGLSAEHTNTGESGERVQSVILIQ